MYNHTIYKKNFYISILIFLLTTINEAALPDNYTANQNVNLIQNILDFGFSPDKKILVVLQKYATNSFIVYDGIRLKSKQTINIQDVNGSITASPSSFSFSPDSSFLIIGTMQGRAYGFQIINGIISRPYRYHYAASQSSQKMITSISVSSDKKIAIAARTQIIILGIPNQKKVQFDELTRKDLISRITSLAWSPKINTILLVGAVAMDNKGFFGIYDTQTSWLQVINNQNTLSVAFFPDGNMMAQGSQNNNIKSYSYETKQQISSLDKTNKTSKILISEIGILYAKSQYDSRILAWKIDQSTKRHIFYQNNQNKQLSKIQALAPGSNFAISNNGNQILIIPVNGSSTILTYTLCPEGLFFDNDNYDCAQCTVYCKSCFNMNICLICENTSYLQNDACITCQASLFGCLMCSDKNTCLSCDQTQNWKPIPNPDTHLCECMDGFFIKNNQCMSCSQTILDCDVCSDQSTCLSCIDRNHFSPIPNEGKCICVSGWTLKDNICQDCSTLILGCLTCSSGDECQSCDDNSNFIIDNNYKCQCKNTFYLNDRYCERCDTIIQDCLTCTYDGKKCQSCQSNSRQPNLDGTVCQCKPKYYEDQFTKACQLCDKINNDRCLKCQSFGSNKCLQCNTNENWNKYPDENGKCTCQPKYYQTNNTCIICSVKGCSGCSTPDSCFQCSQVNNFNPVPEDNKTCACVQNYYPDDTGTHCFTCGQILEGCLQCSNLKACNKCDQMNNYILNSETKLCECQPTYYKNDHKCTLCKIPLKYCDQCIDSTTCTKCQNGFDFNQTDNKCIGCQSVRIGCQICQDKNVCQQCNISGNFVTDGNGCKCKQSYYLKQYTCELCQQVILGCIQCSSANKCIECDVIKNFSFYNDKCVCKQNYYLDSETCKLCSDAIMYCEKCTKDNKCDQCIDTFILNNQTFSCQCAQGFSIEDNRCVKKSNIIWLIVAGVVAVCIIVGIIVWCKFFRKPKLSDQQRQRLLSNESNSVISNSDIGNRINNDIENNYFMRPQQANQTVDINATKNKQLNDQMYQKLNKNNSNIKMSS